MMKRYVLIFLATFGTSSFMACHSDTATSRDEKATISTASPAHDFSALSKLKLEDPLPANLFVELAKKVNPAVVNISTTYRQRVVQQPTFPRGQGMDPFFEFFEQFGQPPGMLPQQQRPVQSLGTGFVIEEDGLILTNNHVVEHADEIKVQFSTEPEKFYSAEVIGTDPRSDIGLIKVKTGKKLTVAELGSSEQLQVGEWVAAFGNPYGHTFSMSKGIVSALSRKIRDLNSVPFIQTDASINPGNSGGPLVDIHGRVIGINSAIDARAQGIGFAIPIDHVKSILPQLKEKGRITYGYVGVQLGQLSPRESKMFGVKPEDGGAFIVEVFPDGPAAKAGLRPYDLVMEFDKVKIKDPNDLGDAVKDSTIGSKHTLKVIREGKALTLNLTVGEPPSEPSQRVGRRGVRPPPQGGQEAPHNVGFKLSDYSEKILKDLNLAPSSYKGPIVVEIAPGSTAQANGLRVGDIILDVNKIKVKTAQDALKNIKTGSNILRVYQNGHTSLVFIEIE